jgi:hypothetical protein
MRLSSIVAFILIIGTSFTANASLISIDLVDGSGNGEIVRDTVNNRDYIRLDLTLDITSQTELDNFLLGFQGFQLATLDQVDMLFETLGLLVGGETSRFAAPDFGLAPGDLEFISAVELFIQAFGTTDTNGRIFSGGRVASSINGANIFSASISDFFGGDFFQASNVDGAADDVFGGDLDGIFLTREAVVTNSANPSVSVDTPATFGLMMLSTLVLLRRKRCLN